jgi:hypothetical protein
MATLARARLKLMRTTLRLADVITAAQRMLAKKQQQ